MVPIGVYHDDVWLWLAVLFDDEVVCRELLDDVCLLLAALLAASCAAVTACAICCCTSANGLIAIAIVFSFPSAYTPAGDSVFCLSRSFSRMRLLPRTYWSGMPSK